jgi:hypothetical protein
VIDRTTISAIAAELGRQVDTFQGRGFGGEMPPCPHRLTDPRVDAFDRVCRTYHGPNLAVVDSKRSEFGHALVDNRTIAGQQDSHFSRNSANRRTTAAPIPIELTVCQDTVMSLHATGTARKRWTNRWVKPQRLRHGI